MRIVADHIRAAVFCIADGAAPSNTDRGYIVRRLIRRAIRHGHLLEINQPFLANVAQVVIENYKDLYPELEEQKNIILEELKAEEEQFGQTLKKGLKEFEKLVSDREENPPHSPTAGKTFEVSADLTSKVEEAVSPAEVGEPASPAGKSANSQITGAEAFNLYQTYGFPLELTKELAGEKNLTVDEVGFEKAFQDHQKKSRTASAKKFIGGLVNHSEIVTRYHTTTHLLHAALRQILGEHVQQQGSNITPERLRFDFSHPEKMTEEELKQVENIVNQKIKEDLPVEIETMSLEEAEKQGALAFFAQKYGNQVKVYSIGNFSKEVCGGPHIKSTGELGRFKIVKEKSIGRGTRRIRAVISGSE